MNPIQKCSAENPDTNIEKTLCAVPWHQFSTKPNGNVRICCLMTNSDDPDKGVLRRGDGSIYNARDKDYLQSHNSDKAKKLRQDMLKGTKNPLCKTCWDKEDVGMKSKRQVTNRLLRHSFNFKNAYENTQKDGGLESYDIFYLDLRFGNECNLKCIMCHPASSSKWYSDYVKINNTKSFRDTGEKIELRETNNLWQPTNPDYYKWYTQDEFWSQLEEQLPSVKQIYLVGGEPLLIKEHTHFLERMVERGHASNVVLEYDTNLTLINQKTLELWKNFKLIKLRVSIESIGEQNDYIRFPSKWENIEKNIGLLSQSDIRTEIDFSITWQIYNLFAVTKIWDKYPDLGNVRLLSSPRHLDVKILPRAIKLEAIQHLSSYRNFSPKVASQTDSMINYLEKNLDGYDPNLTKEFQQYTQKIDKIRKTSFQQTFPELGSLMNNSL